MNIIFDNIIFNLQNAGGISTVWKELIEHLQECGEFELQFLEYEGCTDNIFRKDLVIPLQDIDLRKGSMLGLKRYLNPSVNTNVPFVFHSSHFRTCNNRYAKNISTVHDFTYEYFMNGMQRRLHTWQKNRALLNSDIIHTKVLITSWSFRFAASGLPILTNISLNLCAVAGSSPLNLITVGNNIAFAIPCGVSYTAPN